MGIVTLHLCTLRRYQRSVLDVVGCLGGLHWDPKHPQCHWLPRTDDFPQPRNCNRGKEYSRSSQSNTHTQKQLISSTPPLCFALLSRNLLPPSNRREREAPPVTSLPTLPRLQVSIHHIHILNLHSPPRKCANMRLNIPSEPHRRIPFQEAPGNIVDSIFRFLVA